MVCWPISLWTWMYWIYRVVSLQWRHNGRAGISNHQPHDCLLNRLFRRRSKKASKLRVTGLCAGNSSATGEFPAQMVSKAENVSISWRHHVLEKCIKFWHYSPFCELINVKFTNKKNPLELGEHLSCVLRQMPDFRIQCPCCILNYMLSMNDHQ